MKVVDRATMPNGTAIQIEDWHENYKFMPPASTIAAYPISKVSHPGAYAPKGRERFRAEFNFNSAAMAQNAFAQLTAGTKSLSHYAEHLSRKEYADCL